MLKKVLSAAAASLVAWLLAGVAAVAGAAGAATADVFPASSLLVGSVRDQTGEAMVGAAVTARDGSGRAVGADLTDGQGTFAIRPSADPVSVEARCRHCAPARVPVRGQSIVVVIVRRYVALESRVPDSADLAALPYGRVVDALALVPYSVPSIGGGNVSDRGLDGGRGLVVDDGAPLVDLATGQSALVDFPDRYVRSIAVNAPAEAFQYGSGAGGGRFALDQLDGDASAASWDTGVAPSLALEPALGIVHPAYGVSSDDGTLARRADLDLSTPFAGGYLRAGAGAASESESVYGSLARNLDTARLAYATASRRYRTFVDASASDAGVENGATGASEYRSSYLSGDVRVEHPGPVTLAFGAAATQQTAYYVIAAPRQYDLTGRVNEETLYAEASAGDERTGVAAGLGFTNVSAAEDLQGAIPDGQTSLLAPSLSAHAALGDGGIYARAGYSESSRVPSLLEADSTAELAVDAASPVGSFVLEREQLAESALGYDGGGRLNVEAIAYREFLHGPSGEQRLNGLGGSLAWQVTPLLSLRAWSLRDAPLEAAPSNIPDFYVSRQVVWATYDNGLGGLRVDAIFHRDVASSGSTLHLDGDVLVPVVPHVALALGTLQENVRTYYFGLRAR